jgi:hypothetical protein
MGRLFHAAAVFLLQSIAHVQAEFRNEFKVGLFCCVLRPKEERGQCCQHASTRTRKLLHRRVDESCPQAKVLRVPESHGVCSVSLLSLHINLTPLVHKHASVLPLLLLLLLYVLDSCIGFILLDSSFVYTLARRFWRVIPSASRTRLPSPTHTWTRPTTCQSAFRGRISTEPLGCECLSVQPEFDHSIYRL